MWQFRLCYLKLYPRNFDNFLENSTSFLIFDFLNRHYDVFICKFYFLPKLEIYISSYLLLPRSFDSITKIFVTLKFQSLVWNFYHSVSKLRLFNTLPWYYCLFSIFVCEWNRLIWSLNYFVPNFPILYRS